jgi:hypothetical protein
MSDEVKGLEQQLANTKVLMERRDLAIKLSNNRDFRKLILEDFCVTEAARLVQQSGDPALDVQQRADALNMAQASGHLKRYLSMMIRMGDTAEKSIPDLEDALSEARADEDAVADEAESQEGTLR